MVQNSKTVFICRVIYMCRYITSFVHSYRCVISTQIIVIPGTSDLCRSRLFINVQAELLAQGTETVAGIALV